MFIYLMGFIVHLVTATARCGGLAGHPAVTSWREHVTAGTSRAGDSGHREVAGCGPRQAPIPAGDAQQSGGCAAVAAAAPGCPGMQTLPDRRRQPRLPVTRCHQSHKVSQNPLSGGRLSALFGACARGDVERPGRHRAPGVAGSVLGQVLRDLPDMAAGIGEAGRPYSPGPVHRAVEQLHSAAGQLRAHGIHIINPDGEFEAGTRPRGGRRLPARQARGPQES